MCIRDRATAGVNSGFADEAYTAVGAEILPTIGDVYARAEMIVKVKEPIAPEYKLIRKDQLVFTFFHFASSEPLTRAMIDSGAVCCAYETVERADRSLPLLIPKMCIRDRLLPSCPGNSPARSSSCRTVCLRSFSAFPALFPPCRPLWSGCLAVFSERGRG